MRMRLIAAVAGSLAALLLGCSKPPPTAAEAKQAVTEFIEGSQLIYVHGITELEKTDGVTKRKEGISIYQMFANATFEVHEGGKAQHKETPVQIEFEVREKGWHISEESEARLMSVLLDFERKEQARRIYVEKELRQLCQALHLYRLDYGALPTQEDGFRALTQLGNPRPYAKRTTSLFKVVPIDPWFGPYSYEMKDDGRTPHIRSSVPEFSIDCD